MSARGNRCHVSPWRYLLLLNAVTISSRWTSVLRQKIDTSAFTPGSKTSTPNSLFHSPTRAAPRTWAHATASRSLPTPPPGATSNHFKPSASKMMNLHADAASRNAVCAGLPPTRLNLLIPTTRRMNASRWRREGWQQDFKNNTNIQYRCYTYCKPSYICTSTRCMRNCCLYSTRHFSACKASSKLLHSQNLTHEGRFTLLSTLRTAANGGHQHTSTHG